MEVINVGTAPDDHSGDPLRVAFQKANRNFAELLAAVSGELGATVTLNFDEMVEIQANMPQVAAGGGLAALVAAIGLTKKTIQFGADLTLSANFVCPANIELVPLNGAVINHGAYTISYAGSTARWPLAQIFSGTGAIAGLKEKYPEWFSGGLATAVSQGGLVHLKGGYTGHEITIPSNTEIRAASPDATVTISGTGSIFKTLAGTSNVTIKGVKFVSTLATDYALSAINIDGLVMKGNTAAGCCLMRTYQSKASYALMLDSDLSDNVKIINNTLKGASKNAVGGDAAIALYYVKNATVTGNKISTYTHGVQWWGGDSIPNTGDGILANARKAHDITVANNVIDNVGGGGIWGSMGERVAVTGNTVTNCGDVGIDFEGGFDNVATGNIVKDCGNGGLATYYYVKGIIFSGNKVSSSVAGKNLTMHNNIIGGVSSMESKDISYIGNTFECTAANGLCYLAGDGTEQLQIKANTLKNVAIVSANDSSRYAEVSNNTLLFTDAKAALFKAIALENAHLGMKVMNNTIESKVNQPVNSTQIHLSSYSFSGLESHQVTGNTTKGFGGVDIACMEGGAAQIIRYIVRNNILGYPQFVRSATNTEIYLEGNSDIYGNNYPSVRPTTGYWNAGQKLYFAGATAGGYIGEVCTTAGTPGTWKGFGAIAP